MKIIHEKEAEDFLKKQGFIIVSGKSAKKKKEIAGLKRKIKFPWAVKVQSSKIIHKARAGGVILNVKNIGQAEKAFDRLSRLPGFRGVLIQEMMMKKGQLIILGLKNTPEFGPAIMIGKGGGKVEEIKDISFRICPITAKDAASMIDELKIKIKNKNLAVKSLIRLSNIASRHPEIEELDINPVVITKNRAVVVDARAVLR